MSNGFNLVFPGAECSFSVSRNDLVNQDPKLGPLQDNGGPTPTMALLPGSAAIDAGNSATPHDGRSGRCESSDQRLCGRADSDLNGSQVCDIGAYEVQLSDLCTPRPPVRLATARDGQGGLAVTVTRGLGTVTQIQFHDAPTGQVRDPNTIVRFTGGSTGQGTFTFVPPAGRPASSSR